MDRACGVGFRVGGVMRVSRTGPGRAYAYLSFAVPFLLMPSAIGSQDLASLLAQKALVAARWQQQLIESPFGAINVARFRFPSPVGSMIPPVAGLTRVSLMQGDDVTAPSDIRALTGVVDVEPKRIFPNVDRTGKGDRLISPRLEQATGSDETNDQTAEAQPENAPAPVLSAAAPPVAAAPSALASAASAAAINSASTKSAPVVASAPAAPAAPARARDAMPDSDTRTPTFGEDDASVVTARIYFGTRPLGESLAAIQPWAPGEEPVLDGDVADLDFKRPESLEPTEDGEPTAGESIANKGEVTGEGHRPRTPAERLELIGDARAKAEKCLTDAIYFEARGESVRGQIAVAQVVMNRVFSGYYPNTVCGVVYQNSHRRMRCQFTFACDGIRDRITEPDAWDRAKEIARETLDGKLWLADVGKATHYHAYWVHPSWVREMARLYKIGVHTFYRPRNWGDGSDAPTWGDPAATAEAESKL